MATEPILIRNESEFFHFLNEIKNDYLIDSEKFNLPEVYFNGWPFLHINVKGEKYQSSVNSNLIYGMMVIIEEIQRSYSLIKYGTSNLSKLTNDDKQNLDVIFVIDKGSSNAKSDNSGIINKTIELLKTKMGNMNGWQTMAVFLAMTYAAGHYFYDNNQKDIALGRQKNDAINAISSNTLETIKIFMSKGQTEQVKEIMEHAENGRNTLIKQIASDQTVQSLTINDEVFTKDKLLEYTSRQQIEKIKEQKIDTFIVKGVERTGTYLNDYNIKVIRKSNGEVFTIKADEEFMTKDELSSITSAWENNIDINISYTEARNKNGQILIGSFIKTQ